MLIPGLWLDPAVVLPSLGQGSAQFVQVSVQGLRRLLRWAAGAALVLGLLVLLPRLVIEAQWFAQFDAVTVVTEQMQHLTPAYWRVNPQRLATFTASTT